MSTPGEAKARGIALFDLDYTLLGGDATYEWIHFLVRKGAIEPASIALLDQYYEDYGKGTLDIVAFLHFDFGALTRHPRARMEAWREEYLRDIMAPLILPKARALIASHEARGHVTAIVTAANSFLTRPIAGMIGVGHLLASDPEIVDGAFTGKIDGIACFHEGKIAKLEGWLAGPRRSAVGFPRELLLRGLAERCAAHGKSHASRRGRRRRDARADCTRAQLAGDHTKMSAAIIEAAIMSRVFRQTR
jgi:HAD superfamily phosphoserine phosphatase-like hydrolase